MTQLPPHVPLEAGGAGQPAALDYAPAPRDDLRRIAARQKGIIFCILAYLLLVVAQLFVPRELRPILAIAALGVSITAMVFVFMLSLSLYSTAVGILLGILTLVPLVGLIVLLVVNGKATNLLKRHGVKVGLLGARMSDIPVATH
ncbi:MAG TPA: hypothetical protein VGR35_07645 [Tepidisphaeraceae bacterium]|nr:hypothetical protein [Tepidisphaeraceae bacterium]